MRPLLLASLLCCMTTVASADATWPTRDGVYTINNFRFGTGEALLQLHLHYLTLGTPHTDARGHTDNAILLLHGTGGDAHSLMNPVFADVLFGPGSRWISASTSSSCPMTLDMAPRRSPLTGCTHTFRSMTTTTWCAASTPCCSMVSRSSICG